MKLCGPGYFFDTENGPHGRTVEKHCKLNHINCTFQMQLIKFISGCRFGEYGPTVILINLCDLFGVGLI